MLSSLYLLKHAVTLDNLSILKFQKNEQSDHHIRQRLREMAKEIERYQMHTQSILLRQKRVQNPETNRGISVRYAARISFLRADTRGSEFHGERRIFRDVTDMFNARFRYSVLVADTMHFPVGDSEFRRKVWQKRTQSFGVRIYNIWTDREFSQ